MNNAEFFLNLETNKDYMFQWLQDQGLIAKNYQCPKCGKDMKFLKRSDRKDGRQWGCKFEGHEIRRSVRKNTWFERSNLTMIQIIRLTSMWVGRCKNEYIREELKIARQTLTDWKCFCREVCTEVMCTQSDMLGGDNVIVEIDESKFGKRKYQRGKWVEGQWVFGGVERGTNKCFMVVVEDRSKETLLGIIKKYIRPGTTIISDCWKAYDCLKDEGYQHFSVNHSVTFKDPHTGAHTNSIEGTWSAIKRQLGSNHVKNKFNPYLYEYMWRRRNKNEGDNLFFKFIEDVVKVYPPATKD